MHDNVHIEILLATYNGEKFIGKLVDSILKQTYANWTLLIHDDGSTDSTLALLEKYQILHSDKIKLVIDDITFRDSSKNFQHLVSISKSDYIFFCDQDDIWLENKLKNTVLKMVYEQDRLHHKNLPLLVFSDLIVIDEFEHIISNSFWRYQNIYPILNVKLKFLAARNCVTGNTTLLNKEAVLLAKNMSPKITHDWNIAIRVKRAGGKLIYIKEKLTLYRIHSENYIGAKKISLLKKIFNNLNLYSFYIKQRDIYEQIKIFNIYMNFLEFIFYKFFLYFFIDLIFKSDYFYKKFVDD
jgi:glycosyltransferase involved in cell wall biosynthesis